MQHHPYRLYCITEEFKAISCTLSGGTSAKTNLPKPIEGYTAIGTVRTREGRLQLGLLKEFNPEYLGRKVNTSKGGYMVGFEPVTESVFYRIAGRFSGGIRSLFERLSM